jgi:hypothetical protein
MESLQNNILILHTGLHQAASKFADAQYAKYNLTPQIAKSLLTFYRVASVLNNPDT